LLHAIGEHQPAQSVLIAAEKAGPNLFKACLPCGCKLALVCGRLKPALHLMQLHNIFPAVCCLFSSGNDTSQTRTVRTRLTLLASASLECIMIADSGLPKKWWAKAVVHAANIHNFYKRNR
jgi:hypothetical protein